MWFEPPSLFFFNLTPNNCPKIKGLTSTCEEYDISHKEDDEIPHDKACDKRPLVTHSIWLALVFTTIMMNTLSPSQHNKIFSLIRKRYLGLQNIRLSELLEEICQFSGRGLSHLKQKKNHYENWRHTNLSLFWFVQWMNEWPSTSSIAENFRKYSRKYDKKS